MEENTPGVGLAGYVICPFMSSNHPAQCLKHGCELWVELGYADKKVARCSLAWISLLSTEVRASIDRLKNPPTEK
jgi:hypothetical protein